MSSSIIKLKKAEKSQLRKTTMTNARRHHNVSKLLAIIEADVEREVEAQAYIGISLYNEQRDRKSVV